MRRSYFWTVWLACGGILFSAGSACGNTKSSEDVNVNLDEFLQEIDRANHTSQAQQEARELAGISSAKLADPAPGQRLELAPALQKEPRAFSPAGQDSLSQEPPASLEPLPVQEKTPPAEGDEE